MMQLRCKPTNSTTAAQKKMIDQDLVIKLLAADVPTAQIAAAAGCDPSYISQLRQQEHIQSAVAAQRTDVTLEDIKFDDMLARAEQLALERIEKTLPFANMTQSMMAFKILNTAKRRNEAQQLQQTNLQQNNVTINLTLPSAALPRFVTNAQNEIIEVEGQTMLTTSPRSLNEMLVSKLGVPQSQQPLTAMTRAAARLGSLAAQTSFQSAAKQAAEPKAGKLNITDM